MSKIYFTILVVLILQVHVNADEQKTASPLHTSQQIISAKNLLYQDFVAKISELNFTDHKNIFVKVHQLNEYQDIDHTIYFNDTLLIQYSLYGFNLTFKPLPFDKEIISIPSYTVIDLKNEMIKIIFPTLKKYSQIDFKNFREIYKVVLDSAIQRNEERKQIVYPDIKTRRMSYRDLHLRENGYWSSRFDWTIDTIQNEEAKSTPLKSKTIKIAKIGAVKKKEDTLFYKKTMQVVEGDVLLSKINSIYAQVLSDNLYNFWQAFMLNYTWDTRSLGIGVDTASLDFLSLSSTQFPVAYTCKVNVNFRDRGNALEISFAHETIFKNTTYFYYKNDLSEITDIGYVSTLDTIVTIQDDYQKIEFNPENINILAIFPAPYER